jgi:hypothetical protein
MGSFTILFFQHFHGKRSLKLTLCPRLREFFSLTKDFLRLSENIETLSVKLRIAPNDYPEQSILIRMLSITFSLFERGTGGYVNREKVASIIL